MRKASKAFITVLDGIASLFSTADQLDGMLKAAWEKVRSALNILMSLVKALPEGKLRDALTGFEQSVREKASVRHAIELLYQVSETRAMANDLRLVSAIEPSKIDEERDAVAAIERDFRELANNTLAIAGLAAGVAAIIGAHLTGPYGILAAPAIQVLLIAVVLGAGMSMTNAWTIPAPLRGIRESIRKIESKTGTTA